MKNIKKLVHLLALGCLLATTAIPLGSCSNMGGVTGTIITAQAWLKDPANQATITAIANTAITLITAFGATTKATITDKLARQYPDVPAGAVAEIAKNPRAYLKK